MPTEIITALISGGVTLLVSIGTWQVSIRRDREKAKMELKDELIKYRDDVTQMGANLQNKMSLVELSMNHARNEIATLSMRVDKHNNFEGRIIALEDTDKLLEEKIKVANARILDLENAAKK